MIKKSLMSLVQSNQLMQLVLFLQEADKSLLMENIEDAIKFATEHGYTPMLSVLLVFHRSHARAPFPPSAYNRWLQIATERGDIDTIDLLIYFGADINDILPQLRSKQGDDANALYIMGTLQRKGYEPVIRKNLVSAKENLKKAAEKDHPQAILALGDMHRDDGDYNQARYYFEQLLEHQPLQGDAYCALGHMRQMGEGCNIDWNLAEDDYQNAIRAGNQKAKVFLGQIVHQDQSNPQKQAEVMSLWQDAAWRGDMDACWELMHNYGGKYISEHLELAYCYSLLLKTDEHLGIGKSIGRLGWMHEHECYVRSEGEQLNDMQQAYASYKKAIELGQRTYEPDLARIAFTLGKLHIEDVGALQDVEKGIALLEEAIQFGHSKAARYLARMNESGTHVNKDKDEAERYYQMAIDLGEVKVEDDLNQLHYNNDINEERIAFQCLEQAAQQGDADAQNRLGERYYEGHYYDPIGKKLDENVAKAFYWWRKAAHQGQRDAQNHLKDAYSFLNHRAFLFGENDEQTKVTYHYTMSQGKPLIDLFFNPDSFLSFDKHNQMLKNRLRLSLFSEDELISPADKKVLLEEIIEKKLKSPEHFVACLPTETAQRGALAEVLETISKQSIIEIVQTALASLLGIQPALRRAEQQLQVFFYEQPDDQVNEVKQDLQLAKRVNYAGKPNAMLVYTLLQLQNLITEFRENALEPAQPMANHHAKNLQTFNKTFCLIIQNERVKGNLTQEAHERLLDIYKDLCKSEVQLQQDQDQLTETESFEQALGLRLFALWIGASALASGHVVRQPTQTETLKREIFHMGAALCHIVPGLAVFPEFVDAAAGVIETLHKATEMSHVGLMAASAGHLLHAGWDIYKHKQTPDQKLMNFYYNLGRQGESLISCLVDALNQRFQAVLKELNPQDAAKFGDAMAEHINSYLMSKPLSQTERKNLIPTLIYRCSYYPMNSHTFVKWQGIDTPIAEIMQRLSLRCSYVTAGQTLSCDLTPTEIRESNREGQNRLIAHASEPQSHMLAFEEEVLSFAYQLKHAQRLRLPRAANHGNHRNVNDLDIKVPDPNRQQSHQQLQLEAIEQADQAIEGAPAIVPPQPFQQVDSPLIFDDACIEMHVDKNPQAFKALMTIQPLMEERMDTVEDKIAVLERIVLKQVSELKAMKDELKRLKGENDQEHQQEHDALNQELVGLVPASQNAVSFEPNAPSLSELLPHTTWGDHARVNEPDHSALRTTHQQSDNNRQILN